METTDTVSGMHAFTMLQRQQTTNGVAPTLPYFETSRQAPAVKLARHGAPSYRDKRWVNFMSPIQ
ncbi:hypothetical protein LJR296_007315 [Cupriavidus necator]|uniref:hypothetical protein n=1 Tax=Cupriavidus necator TaxID=106590 RepID=UPI003ECF6AE8